MRINGGDYFNAIMTSLSEMGGYEVQHGLLDAKEHGIPRSRSRVYIAGIRSDVYDQSQLFPTPIARPSLEFFLEKRDARKAREVPPAKQTTARANVEQALESIRLAGEDPLKKPYVIDCDSSGSRADRMFGVSPCIACRRGGGRYSHSPIDQKRGLGLCSGIIGPIFNNHK